MRRESSPKDDPSWHDNLIYAVKFQSADPDAGKWRSNLILDIDHIVEWVRGTDGGTQFLVAPATLVLHDVTDLQINIHFGSSGYLQTVTEPSIRQILKTPIEPAPNPTAGPYFAWVIELNWPKGGEIRFGSSGYTQALRAEPRLLDEQHLPADDRPPMICP